VLIQPGRTIIKTTLGANFEVECAKQLRGAMQKLTKQSVAGACGEDCCGRRLAEQVYAVLRGDERGQLISAPFFTKRASKYSSAGRVRPEGHQLNSPDLDVKGFI
jgi:hypothetical protein